MKVNLSSLLQTQNCFHPSQSHFKSENESLSLFNQGRNCVCHSIKGLPKRQVHEKETSDSGAGTQSALRRGRKLFS